MLVDKHSGFRLGGRNDGLGVAAALGNATVLVDGRSGFRLGGRNDGVGVGPAPCNPVRLDQLGWSFGLSLS